MAGPSKLISTTFTFQIFKLFLVEQSRYEIDH